MKPSETSDYYEINSNNNRYHNIHSMSTKALTSIRENKRSYTQSSRKKKFKFKIYQQDKESKRKFPMIITSDSFYNTGNLYLNKKNYIFRQKHKKKNKYFEKEQLFDRVLKLQTALNTLNIKYNKQKIENTKQSREIEKQNKLLNTINYNNFKEKRSYSKPNINSYYKNKNINYFFDSFKKEGVPPNNDKKYFIIDKERYKIPDNISVDKLKYLYLNLLYEYEQSVKNMNYLEEENEQLKKDYEKIKIANETLISNLKKQCKYLENDNELKNSEILELKKSSKCSKYNEILKEKEIYEKEMKKIKIKLNDALKQIYNYKNKEEEIKKLNEIIKKRDFKIKTMEVELKTLSNNLDETVQSLEDKIIFKDKIIKRQEREIKFKNYYNSNNNIFNNNTNLIKLNINYSKKNIKEIYEKNPEFYQLYIEMKQKGINSFKVYNNNILKKLKEINSLTDNKIIFIESLIDLFNIEDIQSKSLILDFANKEFINNKTLSEIKSNEIFIFETLFKNNNKTLKNNEEIKQILTANEELMFKMNNLFENYDNNKQGFISFNQMREIIKEMKLENIQEELLLFTKSEIFDRMNYYKLILLTDTSNTSSSLEENIEKLNNKLKNYIDLLKENNNCLNDNYFSYLKETIYIDNNEEKNNLEIINIDNFIKFLSIKNIKFDQQEVELLKQIYGIDYLILEKINNKKYQNYLDYKKIINKLNGFIQNGK